MIRVDNPIPGKKTTVLVITEHLLIYRQHIFLSVSLEVQYSISLRHLEK